MRRACTACQQAHPTVPVKRLAHADELYVLVRSADRAQKNGVLAYCLHATLRAKLHCKAPDLIPFVVLEKFAALQMLDVHFTHHRRRELIFTRYTEPEAAQHLL